MRFLLLATWWTVLAAGGEYAVLNTGSRVYADRHEREGDWIRLYANGGSIALRAADVAGFEPEEATPQPRPPAAPQPAAPEAQPTARQLVDRAADRYEIPREFLRSLVAAESACDPEAVSPKGAIGLMQLMPGTAQQYGADPRDPAENVEAGTRHLALLLQKYDGSTARALAAYNAGEGAVSKYNGIPPYRETRQYVERILDRYQRGTKARPAAGKPSRSRNAAASD